MTILYRNDAIIPGSIGGLVGTSGGRIPGPLGFEHGNVPKGSATKATKILDMPPPASLKNDEKLRARSVSWPLSGSSVLPDDVAQGELANCPIPAILAAMANTAAGSARINKLIVDFSGIPVITRLSGSELDTLTANTKDDKDYKGQDKEISSNRYFVVDLVGKFEVSDVFYINYTDGTDVSMPYMSSPKQALWPCVFEKAYASKLGSYSELDDPKKHPIDEFWQVLVGSAPDKIPIGEKTDQARIRDVAKAAGRNPAIAASRPDLANKDDADKVIGHHGYAILGINGSTIELYNAWGNRIKVSLADFQGNFTHIYRGNG